MGNRAAVAQFFALTSEGPLGGALWENRSLNTVLWEIEWGLSGCTLMLLPYLLFGTVIFQDESPELPVTDT